MSVFPKWLLALAAPNLLPVLCAPLFLFGDPLPLQTDSDFLSFLHYLLIRYTFVMVSLAMAGKRLAVLSSLPQPTSSLLLIFFI